MTGSLSHLALKIASALRDAGDDGLTLDQLEALVAPARAQWEINALARHGYTIGEAASRYVLVAEPAPAAASDEVAGQSPPTTMPSGVAAGADPRLFELPAHTQGRWAA